MRTALWSRERSEARVGLSTLVGQTEPASRFSKLLKCISFITNDVDLRASRRTFCCCHSELKGNASNVQVLLLGELVLQRCEEFRVDFEGERTHILDYFVHVVFLQACGFLHFFVPCVNTLDVLCRKDQTCCSDFARSILEERSIEQCNLL